MIIRKVSNRDDLSQLSIVILSAFTVLFYCCSMPWQQLWPDQIKALPRSYSAAFIAARYPLRCQIAISLPAPLAHQLRQGKSQRSDPPGGKRWQRSTCSPSAHCPLQLPGPCEETSGLIFNRSFLQLCCSGCSLSQPLSWRLSVQQCTDQWRYAPCIAIGQPHIYHLRWVITFSSTIQTNQAKLIRKSLYWFSPFFLFPITAGNVPHHT